MRRILSTDIVRGSGGSIGRLFLTAALLAASGCTLPKKPVAPSWEVELNIPMLNQWIDLVDLLDDSEFRAVGDDSIYAFEFEETLERIEMGDDITIDGLDESVGQSIGNFTVPAGPSVSATIQFDAIYPPIAGLTGFTVPVPGFSVPAGLTQDIPSLSAFTTVVIDTGTVSVNVTNRTEVPFTSLGVKLLDDSTGGTEIVDIDVTAGGTDVLNHGETHVIPVSLAGKTLGNDLSIELYGSSPGGTVDVTGDEGIDVEVQFGALSVASATAEVDPISFSFNESVTLPGDATITSATLGGGDLTLTLDNQLPVHLNLVVALDNLRDVWGDPLNFNLSAAPGQTTDDTRDLTDATLQPGDDGLGNQTLSLAIQVDSPGSSGSQVTLAAQDSVAIRAVLSELIIRSITGIIDSTTVEIPEDTFDLAEESGNLLDELRKVALADVDLEITVIHAIGFPAHLELHLVGEGGVPDPVNLDITFDLQPGSEAVPDTSVLDFGDDTALLDFLNAFPTAIRYWGSVTVGDGVTEGSISSTAWVEPSVLFTAPISFQVTEPIVIELDKEFQSEGLKLEEDVIEIQEATLTYRLSSTLGLAVVTRYSTAADSALVYTDPDVELVLTLQSPASTAQDTVVTLTREQWEALREAYWSGIRITIPPSGAEPFKISRSDRIFIKAFATARVLIDPEKGKSGGRR